MVRPSLGQLPNRPAAKRSEFGVDDRQSNFPPELMPSVLLPAPVVAASSDSVTSPDFDSTRPWPRRSQPNVDETGEAAAARVRRAIGGSVGQFRTRDRLADGGTEATALPGSSPRYKLKPFGGERLEVSEIELLDNFVELYS